ncbi:MAG: phytanoyl-CoA dioxygenase family protein [Thiolinea sp.]
MLSQQQMQHFQQQGYLVVEDVLSPAQLGAVQVEYAQRLDALYRDWFRQGKVQAPADGLDFRGQLEQCRQAGVDWFQPLDISLPGDNIRADTPIHFGPAIFAIVTSPRVLDLVESLIGPEITSNPIQHVRIKPPQRLLPDAEVRAHITYTDWHQDRGVVHAEADNTRFVTVWVAITDATVENGCLQVIPGPHTQLYPHCPKVQTAIADGFIDETKAKPLPVRAGGVVLFHPLAPHSSLRNVSDTYRWSFDLRYNVTGEPTGRAHFPDFVARSRRHPETELHDWRQWRDLWHAARDRAARSPHIPQHRWTADSPGCA